MTTAWTRVRCAACCRRPGVWTCPGRSSLASARRHVCREPQASDGAACTMSVRFIKQLRNKGPEYRRSFQGNLVFLCLLFIAASASDLVFCVIFWCNLCNLRCNFVYFLFLSNQIANLDDRVHQHRRLYGASTVKHRKMIMFFYVTYPNFMKLAP